MHPSVNDGPKLGALIRFVIAILVGMTTPPDPLCQIIPHRLLAFTRMRVCLLVPSHFLQFWKRMKGVPMFMWKGVGLPNARSHESM